MLRSVKWLLGEALQKPKSILSTIKQVVTAPTDFGRQKIDVGPRSLQRAVAFYLELFAVAFAIFSSFAALAFFEGMPESGQLALFVVQLLVGIPVLFLLLSYADHRPTFSGLVQSALYVDAVFVLFINAVLLVLQYVRFKSSVSTGDIDTISTMVEKCLTEQSAIYAFLRGQLTFYEYRAKVPHVVAALDVLLAYTEYVLAMPFCWILGKMVSARYGTSVWKVALSGVAAFTLADYGSTVVIDTWQQRISDNSNCWRTSTDRAVKVYSRELVTAQLIEKLNVQMSDVIGLKTPLQFVTLEDDHLLWTHNSTISTTKLSGEFVERNRQAAFSSYCNGDTYLSRLRDLNLPLVFVFASREGEQQPPYKIMPDDCYVGSVLSVGKNLLESRRGIASPETEKQTR